MPRPNPEIHSKKITAVYFDSSGFSASALRDSTYFQRLWAGSNNPNYFELAKQPFKLPVNNHTVSIYKCTELPIHRFQQAIVNPTPVWNDYTDLYQVMEGFSYPDHSADIVHSPKALDRALEAAIKQVSNRKINLAQAFAERQQTANTVADAAKKIAQAILDLKKGKFKKAAKNFSARSKNPNSGPKAGQTLAENWLALQYGWKPLLNDVYGACDALANKDINPIIYVKTRNRGDDEDRILKSDPSFGQAGQIINRQTSYTSKAQVMLLYQYGNSPVSRTASSLGISNPLLLAWELLPYSFVFDWFLPVGKYLEGLGYDDGLIFWGGCTTQLTHNTRSVECIGRTFDSGNTRTTYSPTILKSSDNVRMDRIKLLASPNVPLPKFKNPLSLTHMASALALLRVACR